MLGYPDAEALDITGPLEVFSEATRLLLANKLTRDPAYSLEVVGLRAGPFPDHLRCTSRGRARVPRDRGCRFVDDIRWQGLQQCVAGWRGTRLDPPTRSRGSKA